MYVAFGYAANTRGNCFSGQLHTSLQDCLPSVPPEDALLGNTSISLDGLSSVSTKSIGRQSDGLLIIIPDMSFSCYGSVSSWTGILAVDAGSVQPLSQELMIYLQVWRPLDNGAFDLVGGESLVINARTFGETLLTTDASLQVAGDTHYHMITGSEQEGTNGSDSGIPFQPGDVVGCFIPSTPAVDGASLGLAVRNGSGRGGREVDLLVYPIEGDICEAAVACEGSQVIISSILPQIYPHQCKIANSVIASYWMGAEPLNKGHNHKRGCLIASVLYTEGNAMH